MSSAVHDIPAEAFGLLLPPADALTDAQVRGAVCVWDASEQPLPTGIAVDLGERQGDGVRWFPRACRTHTGQQAYRALLDHAPPVRAVHRRRRQLLHRRRPAPPDEGRAAPRVTTQRHPEPPPLLGLPLRPPQPLPGCERCDAWARERVKAATEGDGSRVSDMNVLIRRHHPHSTSRRGKP
ncbi:hypothetical protein ACFXAZ_07905 [Streptomyces sp. NPDC059477]|uniref:hypothetical protein n=1 Tax=Streptomyces sp. NPDC059477 TaxID=3346847 RepID=UPI00369DD57E